VNSVVVAALGPTNTGKTHRAIDRMLEHPTGMMGLPLRLLAREVYDRVTARVGERRVALVTGEEKRVPLQPDYWICTVEAMPQVKGVDFLAVDEIQLAGHRERGHIFTDRLLHARGKRETWFMGSDTMRPLVRRLVPGATFKHSPRLSQLRSFGRRSLKSLPPRSAVVAFSVDRVYELAESLRRLRGGVAVVLGALSPRTRNAQVAMYQAGEVQHLVATDAIGMGLNLDVHQVAFAGLSKFDGFEQRELTPEELAQIAGRAGRHMNDGTFGTLSPLPELHPYVTGAIENHRFAPVESLVWRNRELDFDSPEALLDSLAAPPPPASRDVLGRVERADDFEALKALLRLPDVRDHVTRRDDVELLWEVCRIPDYRKLLFGQHVGTLREVFLQLTQSDRRLEDEWLSRQVSPLDDRTGDIDALMARLASIRVWTYISNHPGWLRSADYWQEQTRRIEDELGDTLHQRLVERFVERAAQRTRRRVSHAAPVQGPFGKLQELAAELGDGELTEEQFVQRAVDAPHAAYEVDLAGRVRFEGELLARLVRGSDVRSPQVALAEADVWTGGARRQLERRMLALAKDCVTDAMGGLSPSAPGSAAARGLHFRLAQGFGVTYLAGALEQWRELSPEERQWFEAQGVRQGTWYLYVRGALSTAALERRCLLGSLQEGLPIPAGAPAEPWLSRAIFEDREVHLYGYEGFGPWALRFDVVEKIAAAFREPEGKAIAQELLEQLGLDPAARVRVARSLDPSEDTPTPISRRSRRPQSETPPPQQEVFVVIRRQPKD
jgi:ATP-dependent RNA helicase SUPV3L1/SUV3